ncbi:MAG: glycosyltransferase family 4 protein [Leptonema sp. (in: Bacteria)]|nr:glycosyltransferase family 4 protein [Leptonema sp. (in: bacteria)]
MAAFFLRLANLHQYMEITIQQSDLIDAGFAKLFRFYNDELSIEQIQPALLLLDSEVPQRLNQFLKQRTLKQRRHCIKKIDQSVNQKISSVEAIELLYRIFLLVYPDPAGLDYYTKKLNQKQLNIFDLSHILAASRPLKLLFQSGVLIFLYHYSLSITVRIQLKLKKLFLTREIESSDQNENLKPLKYQTSHQQIKNNKNSTVIKLNASLPRTKSLRIAIVNHRAGSDFSGGEKLVLEYAKYLNEVADVELITTTAKDYISWANFYDAGLFSEDGIIIRRFTIDKKRDMLSFQRLSKLILFFLKMVTQVGQSPASIAGWRKLVWLSLRHLSLHWIKKQGPVSSSLQNYLKDNYNDYDLFIFHTYLYDTSFSGLANTAGKAVLIPTAHAEWPLQLPIWQSRFLNPNLSFIFLSEEEREMMHRWFPGIQDGPVLGCGIHSTKDSIEIEKLLIQKKSKNETKGQFSQLYNLDKFVLFTGRIDSEKGCRRLIGLFLAYIEATKSKVKLVLIGSRSMTVPNHPSIVSTGYLNETLLNAALNECSVYAHPSPYESFSFSLLEAMAVGAPVLVTAQSEVLRGHVLRSHGGLVYQDAADFIVKLDILLKNPKRFSGGLAYVNQRYSHEAVKGPLQRYVIEQVKKVSN